MPASIRMQRGLAAARRTDDGEELTVVDVQIDPLTAFSCPKRLVSCDNQNWRTSAP